MHTGVNQSQAGLWVVATPIGNLDDCSPRAVATLRQVDLILCEDTRHSARLLGRHAIRTPLKSLYEHNERQLLEPLLDRLRQGETMALISDAGTPLISDPGYRLVRACHENGLAVMAVPGPCAAIAALSVAGLPSDRFCFIGFLPARSAARKERLGELAAEQGTLIFYEAPRRVLATVKDMIAVFGARRLACQCRELTKAFESTSLATLAQLAERIEADPDCRRGEQVLVVEGAAPRRVQERVDPAVLALYRELCRDLPPARAAALLARHLPVSRRALYAARARWEPD